MAADNNNSIKLTISLDKDDAEKLFLLAIHSDQSLEDVILGMMEETTSELSLDNVQQPVVQRAIEEYHRTGQFDPTKWEFQK